MLMISAHVLLLLSVPANHTAVSPDCIAGQRSLANAILDISAVLHQEEEIDARYYFTHHFRAYGRSFVLYEVKNPDKDKQGNASYGQRVIINNCKYNALAGAKQPGDPLVLRRVRQPDPLAALQVEVRNKVYFPVILNNRLLLDWLEDPKCRIHSAEAVTIQGRNLYQIVFEHRTDPGPFVQRTRLPEYHQLPFIAWVVLDPAKSWRIDHFRQEMTFYYPSNGKEPVVSIVELFGEAKYGHALRGHEVPKVVRQVTQRKEDGQKLYTITWHIDSVAPCDAEDEHFRLSYYGLPEPPGVTWERPTPWWLYSLFAALVLVLLCGVVYAVAVRNWRKSASR